MFDGCILLSSFPVRHFHRVQAAADLLSSCRACRESLSAISSSVIRCLDLLHLCGSNRLIRDRMHAKQQPTDTHTKKESATPVSLFFFSPPLAPARPNFSNNEKKATGRIGLEACQRANLLAVSWKMQRNDKIAVTGYECACVCAAAQPRPDR